MQPETSNEAHDNVKTKKGDHYRWIMAVISMVDLPITAGEIAEQVGRHHFDKTAVSRRLPELEESGKIIRSTSRLCTCSYCSSLQLTWMLKAQPPKQGELFDTSPHKKW